MPLASNQVLRKTLNLVKLFEGFTEQEVADFIRIARRTNVAAGEVIIHQGRHGEDAYIVVVGSLRVIKTQAGLEETLATLEPGDTFGELALLDARARSASVVADSPAILLRFHRESLSLQPNMLVKVLVNIGRLMAGRLRQMNDKVLGASLSLRLAQDAASPASERGPARFDAVLTQPAEARPIELADEPAREPSNALTSAPQSGLE